MPKVQFKLLFWILVLLGADQLSKLLVRTWLSPASPVSVLPFFSLERISNRGIAFGMLEGHAALVIFTSSIILVILVLAALLVRRDGRWMWPFALLVSGSLGNLLDRYIQGSVTDFLRFPYWPAFNLADIFIVLGVLLLIKQLLFQKTV